MTPPEPKKPPRSGGTNSLRAPPSSSPSKSPIATPPRAALNHRERAKHESAETSSTKSSKSTTQANSDDEDAASAESGKDKRIKELEKEMGKMESEFEKELTLLSHKLTNESETSQFWQSKHTSLHQNFLKTDTDLRLLRSELNSINQNREDRDREIKTRISSLMLDRDAFREAYNEAMGELKAKEGEVRELQGQIRGLKSWVSSSGRSGEQVADEVFGEGMGRLGNGVQNWVIVNFRRVRVDVEKASEDMKERLLQLIPTYESLAATSKIHFVQSLVSRLLVEEIFQAYFVGLSKEHANELERVEKYISGFGPVESINTWRSTTLAILRKETPEKFQTETAAIIDSVVNQINTIMASISDIQPSDTRDQSLRALINSSIELSRLLRVQKASFTVIMPPLEDHQKTMFDPDSMEDIGGEDEDTLSEREIRCVTFPGIVKAGDENGERGYLRNVVAKIRVLCAPD